jgi:hypothetical protein
MKAATLQTPMFTSSNSTKNIAPILQQAALAFYYQSY